MFKSKSRAKMEETVKIFMTDSFTTLIQAVEDQNICSDTKTNNVDRQNSTM